MHTTPSPSAVGPTDRSSSGAILRSLVLTALAAAAALAGCGDLSQVDAGADTGASPQLVAPHKALLPTVNIAPAQRWPTGTMPTAAAGMKLTQFAANLDHPRWLYVLPNGDVLVAETNAPPKPEDSAGIKGKVMKLVMARAGAGTPSANRIILLRDADGDGVAETRSVFLENLRSPFGMALVGNELFVANSDAVVKFTYIPGTTRIDGPATKVVDLPAGTINHHWTKNLIASADGAKLYATVGSNSNVAENGLAAEEGRAAIWEIDRATGARRIFASGLRNPNGMGWAPGSNVLWTVANERDEIGSDLVPDYLTSVKEGGFYGWPFSYYGQHVDERVQPPQPDMVAKAIAPDYALGAHVAALGLAFSRPGNLPAPFTQGAFIGEHGSWNRKPHSGYKVTFVPFDATGRPAGAKVDVLTGFLSADGRAYGRPVGVAMDAKNALLVADDVGNVIWRVSGSGG